MMRRWSMTVDRYPNRRMTVEADQKPRATVKTLQHGHKPDHPGLPRLTSGRKSGFT